MELIMNKANSRRWLLAGISVLCLAGVTSLWAADPTTAPTVVAPMATPTTAPAVVSAAVPATAPTGASPMSAARSADQQSSNRQGRGGRGRNNRGSSGGNGASDALPANDPYAVLQRRSIFLKGNQNLIRDIAPRVEVPRNQFPGATERMLVFNGVTIVDDKPEAFVEDLRSNVVGTVKPGDAVAGGTVAVITFDDLAFQVNGQIRHVGLGQDFNGNAAFAVAPTTAPVAAEPNAPGQVVGAGASIPPPVVTPSGMSSEDILARMKAKRQQESQQLNGK